MLDVGCWISGSECLSRGGPVCVCVCMYSYGFCEYEKRVIAFIFMYVCTYVCMYVCIYVGVGC